MSENACWEEMKNPNPHIGNDGYDCQPSFSSVLFCNTYVAYRLEELLSACFQGQKRPLTADAVQLCNKMDMNFRPGLNL